METVCVQETINIRPTRTITFQDCVRLCGALERRFGDASTFQPEAITEGGILRKDWPGFNDTTMYQSIRLCAYDTWPWLPCADPEAVTVPIFKADEACVLNLKSASASLWTKADVQLILQCLTEDAGILQRTLPRVHGMPHERVVQGKVYTISAERIDSVDILCALTDMAAEDGTRILTANLLKGFEDREIYGLQATETDDMFRNSDRCAYPFCYGSLWHLPCLAWVDRDVVIALWQHSHLAEEPDFNALDCVLQSLGLEPGLSQSPWPFYPDTKWLPCDPADMTLCYTLHQDAPAPTRRAWAQLKAICEGGESTKQREFVHGWLTFCERPDNTHLPYLEGGLGAADNNKHRQLRFIKRRKPVARLHSIPVYEIHMGCITQGTGPYREHWTMDQLHDLVNGFVRFASQSLGSSGATCVDGAIHIRVR